MTSNVEVTHDHLLIGSARPDRIVPTLNVRNPANEKVIARCFGAYARHRRGNCGGCAVLEPPGLPHGLVSILPTDTEVAKYLVRHPGVKQVAFAGSTAVGMKVMKTAATYMTSSLRRDRAVRTRM